MDKRDNMQGWLDAIADMMGDTHDAREGTPPLPPDEPDEGDTGDSGANTSTIRPMTLSPKVEARQVADEEWRMARKTYLVREQEEVWRAGYLRAWRVYERPREGVELPPEGVKPMQPIWSIGVGNLVVWSTTDFMHAAQRFHALADGCRLGDPEELLQITGVTYESEGLR